MCRIGKIFDFSSTPYYNSSCLRGGVLSVRKNVEHLMNFLTYIKEHLLCFILGLLFFVLAGVVLVHLPINNPTNIEAQQILIFGVSLENWVAWYTVIGLAVTALWSMYQYTKSVTRRQQEKASAIAQDFSNLLIEKLAIISNVLLKNNEIHKMVAIISNSKLQSFTTIEIINILNDKDCFDKYHKYLYSKRTQKRYEESLKRIYSKNEQEKFYSSFPLLVETTLNQLEAICINISSHAAGSEYIYNSLHQSFLKFVEILAIKISTNNNNNVDKYFTHIIQVYNMWNNEKNRDIEKFEKTQKKIAKLYNKAEKEVQKILEKKNKTV